jgi:hypothetical protein
VDIGETVAVGKQFVCCWATGLMVWNRVVLVHEGIW